MIINFQKDFIALLVFYYSTSVGWLCETVLVNAKIRPARRFKISNQRHLILLLPVVIYFVTFCSGVTNPVYKISANPYVTELPHSATYTCLKHTQKSEYHAHPPFSCHVYIIIYLICIPTYYFLLYFPIWDPEEIYIIEVISMYNIKHLEVLWFTELTLGHY